MKEFILYKIYPDGDLTIIDRYNNEKEANKHLDFLKRININKERYIIKNQDIKTEYKEPEFISFLCSYDEKPDKLYDFIDVNIETMGYVKIKKLCADTYIIKASIPTKCIKSKNDITKIIKKNIHNYLKDIKNK